MAVLVGVVVGGSSSGGGSSGKWFNPYEALGVRKGASEREVKEAYRTLAKFFHPVSSDVMQNCDSGLIV